MGKQRMTVRWRKATDAGHPRQRVIEVETPVTGETTPLQDAILGVEKIRSGMLYSGNTILDPMDIRAEIAEALAAPPTDEQCIAALAVEVARAQKQCEEEDAKAAARRAEEKAREEARSQALRGEEAEQAAKARAAIAAGNGGALTDHWDSELSIIAQLTPAEQNQARGLIKKYKTDKQEAAERAEAEKKAEQERRWAEIAAWAADHGSETLREQIAQGYKGWPRYLHERMAVEIPGVAARLDKKAGDYDVVADPSAEELELARRVAEALTACGSYASLQEAIEDVAVVEVPAKRNEDEDEYCEDIPEPTRAIRAQYRPGKDPSWGIKTILIDC